MLVELLRPATPDLARRWLAALLLVPEHERVGVVAAVERQIIATYDHAQPVHAKSEHAQPDHSKSPDLDVVHPPSPHDGYVEQVVVTYAPTSEKPGMSGKPAKRPGDSRASTRANGRAQSG
ncbi:MAG: hypothetical protein JNL50_10870 [Phycisphaerae bacterium]|nr:hypothetical protein [Phycisphaerae bacterium]